MKVTPTVLPEVLLVEPAVFGDARGYFLEAWNEERYAAHGIACRFVQDNLSLSGRGVLRGLHLQHPGGQTKLVSVLHGAVFDVAVDVRRGSPDFGRWVGQELSAANHRQLYIPSGFAHGFLVLSEEAVVAYKVGAPYRPEAELSVRWDDPDIGIAWPDVGMPHLSTKDASGLALATIDPGRLPDRGPHTRV